MQGSVDGVFRCDTHHVPWSQCAVKIRAIKVKAIGVQWVGHLYAILQYLCGVYWYFTVLICSEFNIMDHTRNMYYTSFFVVSQIVSKHPHGRGP